MMSRVKTVDDAASLKQVYFLIVYQVYEHPSRILSAVNKLLAVAAVV